MRGYQRLVICPCLVVFLLGCDNSTSKSVPAYSPQTFRDEIEALIKHDRYDDAVRYLSAVDPIKQAQHDMKGYLAVAEDLIVLPGVDSEIDFDRNRDWEFPGTSDAVLDEDWQRAATEFAQQYNQVRHTESE